MANVPRRVARIPPATQVGAFGPVAAAAPSLTSHTMTDSVICRLDDVLATDRSLAGGKGANLAVLTRAGLPVPPGIVVTTSAYCRFVADHGLDARITRELADVGEGPDAVAAASARLRTAFEAAPMSDELRDEIAAACALFGNAPVAVRSSATAEDLPEASFAGQQDSILGVVGSASVCDAVRRCWSSLWSARAIAYRRDKDIGHANLSIAVVVQPMVAADVAGVLFTADPRSGRRDRIVVEAASGLGEAVVGGGTNPRRWIINTATGSAISQPDRALLTARQLDTLVDLGRRAADVFGTPQDVEWAVAEGRCWLVQSRPITSLFPVPAPTRAGLRVFLPVMLFAQGIAEPMTPAGNAFFRAMVGGWFGFWLTGRRPRQVGVPPDWLQVVADRLFLDATELLRRPRLARRMVANFALKDPNGSTALRLWLAQNATRLGRGRSTGMPRGLLSWVPSLLAQVAVAVVAPAHARRRAVARADETLTQLERLADGIQSPSEQQNFVERVLPAATCNMLLDQLGAAYAEWLVRGGIELLVRRWLGSSQEFEPVLRWLPHDPTIAMGAALAAIARQHRAEGLEPSPSGPGVPDFLAAFGHRAPDREVDLGLPRLVDDPTYVVQLIEGYLNSGALDTFETGAAQSRQAADALVAHVRLVRGRIPAAILKDLLQRHHELGGLRERPKFDMVRAMALGRRVLQRCGEQLLADGLLDSADDVFFLDGDDVRAALQGQRCDLTALATAHRRTFQRELARKLVPRLLTSEGETVYASTVPPDAATADVLVGTSLSPGVHEGAVRVLDSPVGADLQPGEVLVAASTDPGWTPLFLLAGALVMEVGGVVSHGALVAREYGVPAVAGITDAMTRLHTGQRVRVDGTNGSVTLLSSARTAPPAN